MVANPVQVRTLLAAVREQGRSGPRLVAFFGCLYFAALRPEEAVSLARHNLALPAEGWGELHLEGAEPYAGKEWTDSGEDRDRRQLKQRARGETRTVPCPPELTALIHEHIASFGTGPGGRLFVGERTGSALPKLTIVRAWKRAREETFIEEVVASPLARSPYDLRHAAVSTWLNAGVPAADVAAWAGHSVEILLKIYAKCLDRGEERLRQRVQAALGHRRPRRARGGRRMKLGHVFAMNPRRRVGGAPGTTGHSASGGGRETAGQRGRFRWSEIVPPAGFEPALPPPEGGALSPELRGLCRRKG